ncbi:MarR family winged helix-turn-helix transcriptional regulator [Pararhizobium sp.]|uniref:MarR family winged helix-turn-helix transcriptional regulator n=1 Tax=Pararhizobium sp. TaxID=1977563 RepID=UPI002716B9A6|nr:MarR family winged helix-turn-helix transcriptional regulator [Pararhizobium sp.]MDO9417901.1 MarR family winged helix-turn-helix transcriptional regulator [Pararhizobium sp.]
MNGSCYCILLRKASRKVSSVYDEALAPLGVNIAQFSLMRNIRRTEPVSLTDLATRLELDRSTVGRNTKVLQRAGWVKSAKGDDQREAVLVLSDEGRRILDKGAPLWDEAQASIETRLGQKTVDALHDLLAAL